MIKTNLLTKNDEKLVDDLIDDVICRSLAEDFGIYDNCETDEDFEKADDKHRDFVQYLVNSLTAQYLT